MKTTWHVILLMSAALGSAASEMPAASGVTYWERAGRSLFRECEFKKAARAFEKALADEPGSAVLHYWLGKSYARLADVSSPLFAPGNARKARRNLEEAVRIDPRNSEYQMELFDLYLDSPEWFHGGLERAAELLKRIDPNESDAQILLKELNDSRTEHSGVEWWSRWAVLRTSGAIGSLFPAR